MKKGFLITSLLLLLMVSVFIGCSDDDAATVASAAAAQGYLIGYVNSYSGGTSFEFYADIMPMTNNGFTMDSIVVGDTIADYRTDSYWNVYGDDNYHWTYIYDSDSPYYTPGDTAEVNFYRNGTMTTLNVELIDYETYPNVILPVDEDSISLGEEINVLWNTNPDADWYGISIRYYKDSAGTYTTDRYYLATTDTTLTIPAATNIYDGYYRIYIISVIGPGPGDPLNLNSGGMIGEFHSYTGSEQRRVYVGTGDPTPVSDGTIEPGDETGDASRAIMDHFSGHKLRNENR